MLHTFLLANRSELIERCRVRVAGRRAPRATPAELEHGIPLFLDQLTAMLPEDDARPPRRTTAGEESRISEGATRHGSELLRHDFSIDQVVHDYGDLCQSIMGLASEQGAPITVEEFGVLNIRLDNAIAGAVTEYAHQREAVKTEEGALATNERLGAFAAEMRNLLNTAIVAIAAIRGGGVGFGGATAAALDRSLLGLRGLLDRTLAEVRLSGEPSSRMEVIELATFIAEVRVAATLEASTTGCELSVAPVARGIFVEADRHLLAAAVSNLLQNAFGCTRADGHVGLRVIADQGRVRIEMEDAGVSSTGGTIDPRSGERRTQAPAVALSRKGVEASGGRLHVREVPGRGSVFTIELPQKMPDA